MLKIGNIFETLFSGKKNKKNISKCRLLKIVPIVILRNLYFLAVSTVIVSKGINWVVESNVN